MTTLSRSAAVFCCVFFCATNLSIAKDATLTPEQKLGFQLVTENAEVYQTCLKTEKSNCAASGHCVLGGAQSDFCLPKFFSADFIKLMNVKDIKTSTLKKCSSLNGSDSASCKTDDGCGGCGKACVPTKNLDGDDFKLSDVCVSRNVPQLINTDMSSNDAKALYVTCPKLNTQCSTNANCHEAITGKLCVPKTLETKSLTTNFISMFSLTETNKLQAYTTCVAATTAGTGCVDCGSIILPSEAKGKLAICGGAPSGITAAPTGITTAPAGVTAAPAGNTAAPAGNTAAPAGNTAAPAGITAAPAGVTAAPAGNTAAPAGNTAAPTDTDTISSDTTTSSAFEMAAVTACALLAPFLAVL